MASSERIFALLDTPSMPRRRPPARWRRRRGARASATRRGHRRRARPHRVRPRLVRLRRRALGARGRDVHGRAGRAGRAGRRHRLGQDDAHEPAAALLRAAARRDPRRRPAARGVGPAALRAAIGLVLQDVFLFSGTIETNLRLGDAALTREASSGAAREVHAHEFIERAAGRLRRRGARARRHALGGPEAAAVVRPRARARPRRARARRGHLERGHAHRAADPGRRCTASCRGARAS